MTDAEYKNESENRPKRGWPVWRVLLWVFGIPAVLVVGLYIRLLVGPVAIPFVHDQAVARAAAAMPSNIALTFDETSLALEYGIIPVMRFSPVSIADSDSGADIKMEALEVGFSPIPALFGQPGVSVTMVKPHLQVIQDLFGPRLAGFELVDDEDGNDASIWVLEGDKSLPSVRISSDGLDVLGAIPDGTGARFRSDNDWMIFNMMATEEGLIAFEAQSEKGRFSRFRVRDGSLDMHDSVFGLLREFVDIELDISPKPVGNVIAGSFKSTLAGRTVEGDIERTREEDGSVNLIIDTKNIDYATLVPFMDDPLGMIAVRGAGRLGAEVNFSAETGEVTSGIFDIDLSGTNLRIQSDLFPIQTKDLRVFWNPKTAQFRVSGAEITIGESSAIFSGLFVTGLDDTFGPTVSMAVSAQEVSLQPLDMAAPDVPFSEIAMTGWAAPLYGATGIDQMVVRKGTSMMRIKGRTDMLRSGLGLDLEVGGEGFSADDLKRLWPYFLGTGARDWFVKNVSAGQVESAAMRVRMPFVEGVSDQGEVVLPAGALSIDIVGTDVQFTPFDDMPSIAVDGRTRVQLRDAVTSVMMDGATIDLGAGPVSVADARLDLDYATPGRGVFTVSGNVGAAIPALVGLVEAQFPAALDNVDVPVNLSSLEGEANGSVELRVVLGPESETESVDYAINGKIDDFASSEPIEGITVNGGALAFAVSPAGYNVVGTAAVNSIEAQLNLAGEIDGAPELTVSAELDVAELAELGFDASEYLSGSLLFSAKPLPSGALAVSADLKQAGLTVRDLGINKAVGVDGLLEADVRQDGDAFDVENLSLRFGDVDIRGELSATSAGLNAAEFSNFKLSEGDSARLSVNTSDAGTALQLRGEQLDLKPMLRRFFALDQISTGGPQSTQFDGALELDVELDRAIGFYRTIAYGLDLDMALVGEDLRRVAMQAQFAEGNSVSVATNPTQAGRTMSVAFNDAGTMLRFLNVYPRLLGGAGSLTLAHNVSQQADTGTLTLRDFAIVDEEKVVEVLGNHRDSRALVENQNRLDFNKAQVDFVRRSDRIEVVDGVLDGDTTGGTMRGFVYTKAQEYDLVGTYVPLFALNSIFQKLPLFGALLGGRDGEGLVGVTFAIRGNLDDPQFLINPASVLVPGAFRSLFEFRAREAPRETQ